MSEKVSERDCEAVAEDECDSDIAVEVLADRLCVVDALKVSESD